MILHDNLPIIEVTDAHILDDLYADPRTAVYLLTRLSGCIAIVAPGQFDILLNRLLKQGHTPKVIE